MIGITLTADQIRNAPKAVREWIEHEAIASLGLAAQMPISPPSQAVHLVACSEQEAAAVLEHLRGMLGPIAVFFEFGRRTISFGEPPLMTYRLIDILHHTKLQNIEQVVACLEAINQAFVQTRVEPSVRFCSFDNEGHCFVLPQTQMSIAALWHDVVANQEAAA
jgi:hypothetical protein